MTKLKMERLPEELRKTLGHLFKNYTEEELISVVEAYEYAKICHSSQIRKSGEPYINHPLNVALILAELNLDIVSIKAGLLHDVAEDTNATLADIRIKFGEEVAHIVDGVTKIDKIDISKTNIDKKAETILKMFFAMAQDIRVILVKLADRLHNMRTIDSMPRLKQEEKSKETFQIFSPIAHRLGIHSLKWQLEDLAFKHLYPNEYEKIADMVDEKRANRELITEEYKSLLQLSLARQGINCDISGREKHFFSIWQKMTKRGKAFDEIYDLIALRVLTETERECYYVMGLVHNLWKPIPGRVKDYIATPKSNGYRSLHTTVITHRGEPLEIQIRSKEMHNEAEYGLAAHWIYKEGKMSKYQQNWLKKLVEWHQDYKQGYTGFKDFQNELQVEEVYIFTPKGEVKHLPAGATTIDFAYSVHTEVGHHFAGAKVNGKIVQNSYELKNGDIVEIIVNKNRSGPSLDWLKWARSSSTRAKIRRFFKKRDSDRLVDQGKDILRKASKRLNISIDDILASEKIIEFLNLNQNFTENDILMKIGDANYSPEQIITLFAKEEEEKPIVVDGEKVKSKNTVFVNGESGIDVKIAHCCNPLPGDKVVGIMSKKGITIHAASCPNAQDVKEGEIVDVKWGDTENEFYLARIVLESSDTSGKVLKDIIQRTKEKNLKMKEVNTKFNDWDYVVYTITVYVRSAGQLNDIIEYWKGLKGISRVYRARRK